MTERDLDVLALLTEAVRVVSGHEPPHGLTVHSSIGDLHLDSVAMLTTVGWLEDRLHVRLMDAELAEVNTVGDLADLVRRKWQREGPRDPQP